MDSLVAAEAIVEQLTHADDRLPVWRQSRIRLGGGAAVLRSKPTPTCRHERGVGQASFFGGFSSAAASSNACLIRGDHEGGSRTEGIRTWDRSAST
jgi:hypothetical protein